jgi:hypothetical protein
MMWMMGMETPPPLFLSHAANCLVFAPIVFCGIAVLAVVPFLCGTSFITLLYPFFIIGLLVQWWRQAGAFTELGAKLNLPPWEDYPKVVPEAASAAEAATNSSE